MKHFFILLFLLLPYFQPLLSQTPPKKGSVLLLNFGYSYQTPLADLEARFGNNAALSLQTSLLTKNNFVWNLKYGFLFGENVKQDVIKGLRTTEGFIVGTDRNIADIQLRERGFFVGADIGKLFIIPAANARAGILVQLGTGLLQHKIRIQDDPQRIVPQLSEDYKKGYDRLSNGIALHQFIGYQYLSANNRINFSIGIEAFEGSTQNRRDWNFDTQSLDSQSRTDILLGVQANWILPIMLKKNPETIIY
jgi:hypothetical protein